LINTPIRNKGHSVRPVLFSNAGEVYDRWVRLTSDLNAGDPSATEAEPAHSRAFLLGNVAEKNYEVSIVIGCCHGIACKLWRGIRAKSTIGRQDERTD